MMKTKMASEMILPGSNDPQGQPYTDCFARACKHLVDKQGNLYTTTRPPIIIVDGRCMGFET